MRVVGGVYGGRPLAAPKGNHARPTSDRVRESLFAILRDAVVDAVVLDLYAGSGALGIEALSRGARHATFVDQHPRSVSTIRSNLKSLAVPADASNVVKATAAAFLGRGGGREAGYDLVFLDPPYDHDLDDVFAPIIDTASHSLADATLIVEHASRSTAAEAYGRFARQRAQRYGDTTLSFFRADPRSPV